jgi:hypothetical protein
MDDVIDVKHPDVVVSLSGAGTDASAFLGRVKLALALAGYRDEVPDFMQEATSGDYEHLLATVQRWVTVQ